MTEDYDITCWKGDVMKIKVEQDLSCSEIEVTTKYPQKSRQVNRIIDLLQSVDMQIKCDNDNIERMIWKEPEGR